MELKDLLLSFLLVSLARARLVTYTANITIGNISPDGRTREAWLINGKTPGPPLIATEGDHVSVRVYNNGKEPITIHFHGIEQIDTIWSDGVPGITQFPIGVGHSLIYNWTADKPGAYWFHSHNRVQLDDGLRAPIFIRPFPPRGDYFAISDNPLDVLAMRVVELIPYQLFVYDYKKYSAEYYETQWEANRVDPLCIDSILINGKGQVVCEPHSIMDPLVIPPIGTVTDKGCAFPNNTFLFSFPGGNPAGLNPDIFLNCNATSTNLEVFLVTKFQRFVAFNLLNAGSVWDLKVSIDSHKLIVFAADGQYVTPQTVDTIIIPIGERYQFFVKLDQEGGDYAVRVASAAVPQMITGFAVLRYQDAIPVTPPVVNTIPAPRSPKINYAGQTIDSGIDLNPALLSPFPAIPPPGPSTVTVRLDISRPSELVWQLNTSPWMLLPNDFQPILFNTSQSSLMSPDIYTNIPLNSIVDVIITVTAGNPSIHPSHPIHKHGRKGWLLGSGDGPFPYESIAAAQAANFTGINMVNPPLRDDFLTPLDISGIAWLAFRFEAVDAAPILMHCHIDPHLFRGMAYLFIIGGNSFPAIPPYYSNFQG